MPRTTSSPPDSKLVGHAIRSARLERGLTQQQLAERLEVSAAYIQKVEAGRANPTIGQLGNVARALSMDLAVGFVPAPVTSDPFAELAQI